MNSTKKMTPTLSNQSKMQLTSVYCDALRYVALNKLAVSNSGKYLVV